jgi:hypothetical protein
MRSLARVLAPLALLLTVACGHTPQLHPANEPQVQLIAESYPIAEIRAAMVRSLDSRKFSAEREEEGRIFARYERKGETLHVSIEYSPTEFAVRYLASSGMSETTDASGAVLVDKRCTDLMSGLEKTIKEELKRPAKERAAAERNERAYETMLQMARTAEATANAQAAAANAQAASDQAAQAQASDDAANANAAAAQAQAAAPAPTTVVNNTYVRNNVQNNNVTVENRGGPVSQPRFCDKAVKAVWICPNMPSLEACMQNRGKCSELCRVGGGC